MNSPATETYPYTVAYVSELLKIEESHVLSLCQSLGIQPHRDDKTGRLFLSIRDVDALKKSITSRKAVAPASANGVAAQQAALTTSSTAGGNTAPAKAGFTSVPQRASVSRNDLSLIVESVSNAKEEILKDLSQLLDDKLSGLDDVVVELIRSKSENDSLREELKRLEESRDRLQAEIGKYKPAAFGFYRKEG